MKYQINGIPSPVEACDLVHSMQTLVSLAYVYKSLFLTRKQCDMPDEVRMRIKAAMESVANAAVANILTLAQDPAYDIAPECGN